MSAIVNTRDLLLQATSPRLVPIPIPISSIEGLDSALANAGRRVDITATSSTFAGVNNPTSITLTAELKGGLTGEVVWSVVTGALTLSPNGNTCVINNTSMTTASAVIRARVTVDGINYDGKYTLTKLGSLAAQDYVNLQTQVAGQLNSGNITGLGALALLNTVNLNTQVTGALDANTQVNNLGALAYVNGLAANQIGAGQLAAGVVYAGQVVATQIKSGSFAGETFTGGTFSGSNIQTNTGTIGGVRINTNGLNTGGFSGYAWPTSGQNGFYLGPYGLLLGNANDGKYFQVTSDGNIYAPGFSVVGGNATFSGSLSGATGSFSGSLNAATGSFSGSLTANAINAVNTINIAGNAVTFAVSAYSTSSLTVGPYYSALQSVSISSTGAPVFIMGSTVYEAASTGTVGTLTVRLVRGGTVLSSISLRVQPGETGVVPIFFTDTVSVGHYTYTIEAASSNVNTYHDSRSMFLLETKR